MIEALDYGYGQMGREHTRAILQAYEETRSCERTSLRENIFASSMTVSRVVRWAIDRGILDPSIRPNGRPRVNREKILSLAQAYPRRSRDVIARLAECSPSSVCRVLKEASFPSQRQPSHKSQQTR